MPDVDIEKVKGPALPIGISHMVFNVRDIEESEKFWTEMLGFLRCAVNPNNPGFRFYNSPYDEYHHTIALVQAEDPGPPPEGDWSLEPAKTGPNHISIKYASRDSWLQQVGWLKKNRVKFHRRTNHGSHHSVYGSDPNGYGIEVTYDLPHSVWGHNIQAAEAYSERIGPDEDQLVDDPEYPVMPPGGLFVRS